MKYYSNTFDKNINNYCHFIHFLFVFLLFTVDHDNSLAFGLTSAADDNN